VYYSRQRWTVLSVDINDGYGMRAADYPTVASG